MSVKRRFSSSIDTLLREALEGDLDHLIQSSQILKNDKTTTVAKLDVLGNSIVIKRYNARSFWHRIKRALRQSRAKRCWDMSDIFANVGLQVAPRIAMVEKRWGPFCLDAYFVAEFLEAEEFLTWLPSQLPAEKAKAQQQVNRLFSTFQQHRLSHGDMKATNLLWFKQGIVFLDLDAAKQHYFNVMWLRAYRRDKKRFAKNGPNFVDLI